MITSTTIPKTDSLVPLSISPTDPLRLTLSGTTVEVSVALNPETGEAGIIFNGVFYRATLPQNLKDGERLKAILKAENDLLLLKILRDTDAALTDKNERSLFIPKPTILSPVEKKFLRESLSENFNPHTLPPAAQSSVATINPEKSILLTATRSNQSEVFIRSPHNLKPEIHPTNQQSLGHSTQTASSLAKQPLAPVLTQPAHSEALMTTLSPALLSSKAMIVDQASILSEIYIPSFSREVSKILKILSMTKDLPEKEIFALLKKTLSDSILTTTPSTLGVTADKTEVAEVPNSAAPLRLRNSFTPGTAASEKKSSLVQNLERGFIEAPIMPKEIMASMIHQLSKATDVLERIHAAAPQRTAGVYFLFPFFAFGNPQKAEVSTSSDEHHETPKKKKPQFSRFKVVDPVLGELFFELFSFGEESHLKILTSSESAFEFLKPHQLSFEKQFYENGIRSVHLQFSPNSQPRLKPDWILEELGVEALV